MKAVSWRGVLETLRRTGPYLLVELLLPGGTLLALLLWLSNGVGRGHFADVHQAKISPAGIERVLEVRAFEAS
jgi:hypothetical protein